MDVLLQPAKSKSKLLVAYLNVLLFGPDDVGSMSL
jgi:hypothetical protein